MQFVISSIQSIFGTGANISAIKDNNKDSVFSGFILGTILGVLILGSIVLNIDKYITFMNMDIQTYRIFAVYAVIQLFLQLLLNLALCKLYYEDNTTNLLSRQIKHLQTRPDQISEDHQSSHPLR